jgi:hypothetical protein
MPLFTPTVDTEPPRARPQHDALSFRDTSPIARVTHYTATRQVRSPESSAWSSLGRSFSSSPSPWRRRKRERGRWRHWLSDLR